ncbi:hypothetical protein EDB83DRAFT_1788209 [Lactarius deliciosus]|nr:hypothetical protein EDB83DRAFT_1788209 [Lactarius deliciosus]
MADITLIQMTPLRGSGRPTTRLCPTQARLRTCSKQVVFPNAIWVDNAFLTVKVPCPRHRVTSAFPSSITPPSRSSPPERESNMTATSSTGPGDDPRLSLVRTPVKQTQHEGRNARRRSGPAVSVRSALSMRIHTPCDRVRPLLPLLVPPGALRPRNSVFPHAACQRRPPPLRIPPM